MANAAGVGVDSAHLDSVNGVPEGKSGEVDVGRRTWQTDYVPLTNHFLLGFCRSSLPADRNRCKPWVRAPSFFPTLLIYRHPISWP